MNPSSRPSLQPLPAPAGRRRATAALVVALALGLAWLAYGPTPARAALPSHFVGTQAWNTPDAPGFQRIGRANVGYFRSGVNWADVEATRGTYDWAKNDELFRRTAAAGVRVLPVLTTSPEWAARRQLWPPASAEARAAFARWVAAAVARYAPGGSFWTANPDLNAAVAPIYWQVWNEPNLPVYWNDRPNPREYSTLLRIASRAAKAASPRVKIVAAGLPESHGIAMATFVRGLERSRSTRRAFDVLALHPYARNHRGVLGAIERTRAILRRHRDTRKAIWLTEIGWATGPRPDGRGFVTSEVGQAVRLRTTYRALWRLRRKHRLLGAIWFSYQDPLVAPGDLDWWAVHTGLLRTNGEPKPAWHALLGVTGGQDIGPGPAPSPGSGGGSAPGGGGGGGPLPPVLPSPP